MSTVRACANQYRNFATRKAQICGKCVRASHEPFGPRAPSFVRSEDTSAAPALATRRALTATEQPEHNVTTPSLFAKSKGCDGGPSRKLVETRPTGGFHEITAPDEPQSRGAPAQREPEPVSPYRSIGSEAVNSLDRRYHDGKALRAIANDVGISPSDYRRTAKGRTLTETSPWPSAMHGGPESKGPLTTGVP